MLPNLLPLDLIHRLDSMSGDNVVRWDIFQVIKVCIITSTIIIIPRAGNMMLTFTVKYSTFKHHYPVLWAFWYISSVYGIINPHQSAVGRDASRQKSLPIKKKASIYQASIVLLNE